MPARVDDAAQKLRSAIEQHEPGTYWGPDGAQVSRDELLALLDVEEAAWALYEINFFEQTMRAVEAKLPLQDALRRVGEARSV